MTVRGREDGERLERGDFSRQVPHTSFPVGVLPCYTLPTARVDTLYFPPNPLVFHGDSTRRGSSRSASSRPVAFFVPVQPVAQPRVRIVSRTTPQRTWGYTPYGKRVRAYKTLIAIKYKEAAMKQGLSGVQPFSSLSVSFFFAKTARGDIDNYLKAVMDALQGVAFQNDKHIKSVQAVIVEHTTLEGVSILLC